MENPRKRALSQLTDKKPKYTSCPLLSLPPEIFEMIFDYIHPSEWQVNIEGRFCRLSQVCSTFRNTVNARVTHLYVKNCWQSLRFSQVLDKITACRARLQTLGLDGFFVLSTSVYCELERAIAGCSKLRLLRGVFGPARASVGLMRLVAFGPYTVYEQTVFPPLVDPVLAKQCSRDLVLSQRNPTPPGPVDLSPYQTQAREKMLATDSEFRSRYLTLLRWEGNVNAAHESVRHVCMVFCADHWVQTDNISQSSSIWHFFINLPPEGQPFDTLARVQAVIAKNQPIAANLRKSSPIWLIEFAIRLGFSIIDCREKLDCGFHASDQIEINRLQHIHFASIEGVEFFLPRLVIPPGVELCITVSFDGARLIRPLLRPGMVLRIEYT